MKTIKPFLPLVALGVLWFVSGYLLNRYWFPGAMAYFIFPVIAFGVVPYFWAMMNLLLVMVMALGVWFCVLGSIGVGSLVLLLLGAISLLLIIDRWALCGGIEEKGEGEDGISEDKTG